MKTYVLEEHNVAKRRISIYLKGNGKNLINPHTLEIYTLACFSFVLWLQPFLFSFKFFLIGFSLIFGIHGVTNIGKTWPWLRILHMDRRQIFK